MVVGAATSALCTLATMRMDAGRLVTLRNTAGEVKAAIAEDRLATAIDDIQNLEQRMVGAECEIAALKARTFIG